MVKISDIIKGTKVSADELALFRMRMKVELYKRILKNRKQELAVKRA